MKRIMIYGTGEISSFLSSNLNGKKAEIVAYIDNALSGKSYNNIKVIHESIIPDINFDYLIIAFGDVQKGIDTLVKQYNIPKSKIAAYNFAHSNETYRLINNKVQNEIYTYLNHQVIEEIFELNPHKYFLSTMRVNNELSDIIEFDYVREQTLALLGEEIYRKNIIGDVAELGVYKGEFSKKINKMFPNRKLYLFDTFEGFNKDEIINDNELTHKDIEEKRFKDTSIDEVLSKMQYQEQCIVNKGYFPASFKDEYKNKKFAFVSIDVDLFDPIYNGLEVFYHRLSGGGVHNGA